jgi:two-component system LytT family sensor kinase
LAFGFYKEINVELTLAIIFTWASFFLGWSVLYTVINYRLELEAQRDRLARAEALAQTARLQALRSQLEPHFLFNTLNAISTLIIEKRNAAAERMINGLSQFLRLTLDKATTHEITVSEELEFARRYAEIQEMRFGDRLKIIFDIDPSILHALVPALILQPLVENAVKHGVLSQERPGSVTIAIRPLGKRLRISVIDDGPGLVNGTYSEGLGLTNSKARLSALYGDDFEFSIGAYAGRQFAAIIGIPLGKL